MGRPTAAGGGSAAQGVGLQLECTLLAAGVCRAGCLPLAPPVLGRGVKVPLSSCCTWQLQTRDGKEAPAYCCGSSTAPLCGTVCCCEAAAVFCLNARAEVPWGQQRAWRLQLRPCSAVNRALAAAARARLGLHQQAGCIILHRACRWAGGEVDVCKRPRHTSTTTLLGAVPTSSLQVRAWRCSCCRSRGCRDCRPALGHWGEGGQRQQRHHRLALTLRCAEVSTGLVQAAAADALRSRACSQA